MSSYRKAIADARQVLAQHSKRSNKEAKLRVSLEAIRKEAAPLDIGDPTRTKLKEWEAQLLVATGQAEPAATILTELLEKMPKARRWAGGASTEKRHGYLKRLLAAYEAMLKDSDRSVRLSVKQRVLVAVEKFFPATPVSREELRLRIGYMKLGMGRDNTVKFLDAQTSGLVSADAADEALRLTIEAFNSDPSAELYGNIANRISAFPRRRRWPIGAAPPTAAWLVGNVALQSHHAAAMAGGRPLPPSPPLSMQAATAAFLAGTKTLGQASLRSLWPLIDEKLIWSAVYEGDEATKRSLTDALFASAFSGFPLRGKRVTGEVRRRIGLCLGFLEEFWQDPVTREGYLARLENAWSGVKSPRAYVAKGQIAVLRCEHDQAEQFFMTAEELDVELGLAGSGHSTFISPAKVKLDALTWRSSINSPDNCKFTFRYAHGKDDGGPIAVTCADTVYFKRFAIGYAGSLWSSAPKTRVHFHVMGDLAQAENTLAKLKEIGGPFSVSTETPAVAKPYYYACARFLRAIDFAKLFDRPMMVTDIDLAFNGSPEACLNAWGRQGDIGMRTYDKVRRRWLGDRTRIVRRYPRLVPWQTLAAGCVYAKSNGEAKWFLEILANHTSDAMLRFAGNRGTNWWIDQNILFSAYIACQGRGRAKLFSVEESGIPFGLHPVEGPDGRSIGLHPAFKVA